MELKILMFDRIRPLETNQFVGSSLNVILTRQTCGQRSSIAVESKRGARGNYFPERSAGKLFS